MTETQSMPPGITEALASPPRRGAPAEPQLESARLEPVPDSPPHGWRSGPQNVTTMPPLDVSGEYRAASLALNRCRAVIKKSNLSDEWKHWVARSILRGVEAEVK